MDGDAPAFARAYQRNRAHLEPWDPIRPESFWTAEGQQGVVADTLQAAEEGRGYAYALWHGDEIVGRAMLTHIVRAPLESGTLGYWIDREHTGRGLATALAEHVALDALRLGLHRLEAGTMLDNTASQTVLRRARFEQYGLARGFLFIRGQWRDHLLFQRLLHDDPPG